MPQRSTDHAKWRNVVCCVEKTSQAFATEHVTCMTRDISAGPDLDDAVTTTTSMRAARPTTIAIPNSPLLAANDDYTLCESSQTYLAPGGQQ